MIKTGQELQAQAIAKGLTFIPLRDCSICGYTIGYRIRHGKAGLDTGCDCVNYGPVITPISWDSVADTFNRNQPENNPNISQAYLDSVNTAWQFD